MEVAATIVFIGILVFLAHLFVDLFGRTKIPDVLFLIIIGFLLGPIFGLITPATFGEVGPVFTTVTLVIILFESGIGLRLDTLIKSWRGSMSLTYISFLATMLAVTFLVWPFTELDLIRSLMLGAIVGGTSSAVVIPLVSQLKMQAESRTMLVLESAISDVLCIVVALALLEAIKIGELRVGVMLGHIIATFALALIFGIIAGLIWSILLNRMRTLKNSIFTTPAFIFVIYGVVELLGYSGAIASLAFGVTLGNIELFKLPLLKRITPAEPIALNEYEKLFFSDMVFIIKTFFFIYVGLSIILTNPWLVWFGLFLTIIIYLVRMVAVRAAIPQNTTQGDAILMTVLAPKGLAAAVLAAIPLQQEISGGELIQSITYAIILFSIILTAILIFLLQKTKLSKFYQKIFSGFSSGTITSSEQGNKISD